jgi:hypothetical protein
MGPHRILLYQTNKLLAKKVIDEISKIEETAI